MIGTNRYLNLGSLNNGLEFFFLSSFLWYYSKSIVDVLVKKEHKHENISDLLHEPKDHSNTDSRTL